MAKNNESVVDKKLTVREPLTIRLIQFMIKVIKPTEWGHDLDEANEHINKLLDKS